jgi:hypothetical protein
MFMFGRVQQIEEEESAVAEKVAETRPAQPIPQKWRTPKPKAKGPYSAVARRREREAILAQMDGLIQLCRAAGGNCEQMRVCIGNVCGVVPVPSAEGLAESGG